MYSSRQQSGFALLMLMVVLLGVASYALSNILSASIQQKKSQSKLKNIEILKQAKEALLSYSIDYVVSGSLGQMGRLPCPDTSASTNNEGNQDANCGSASSNSIGYFPYKTLGYGKIEDATNECLWYVVSGDYKNFVNSEMLNWDSVGYINIEDENGIKKHSSSEEDFPIALIISPGDSIGGQDRTAIGALPNCKANYTLANYLEGGPNIDYSTDLPATADTLWDFLSSTEAAYLDNPSYNDHVVAIYKNELWDRVKQIKDLEYDNSNSVPATSQIELLTQSLAECIATYGNANALRQIPYPSPITLSDYRVNNNYNDNNSIRYGRFPQIVNSSFVTQTNFVLDTAANSYCEGFIGTSVTDYDELFWENWKDHFYLIISEDFDSSTSTSADTSKCSSSNCITVDSKPNKVAAMILFAGEKQVTQDRVWWWDEATASVTIDDKSNVANYLEGVNNVAYVSGIQDYTTTGDYSYCVEYDNTLFTLSAIKCSDL